MNNRKLIGNAILALSLLATGASFAEEAGTKPQQGTSNGTEVRSQMANMTPEQREKMKAERKEHKAERREHRAEHKAERREHRAEHRAERKEHRTERPGR